MNGQMRDAVMHDCMLARMQAMKRQHMLSTVCDHEVLMHAAESTCACRKTCNRPAGEMCICQGV